MAETHTGGCVCGAIRFRVEGKPAIGMVCHCRFCQRRLASAFAVVAYFDARLVEFIEGTPATYEHRSDESGRWLKNWRAMDGIVDRRAPIQDALVGPNASPTNHKVTKR